MLAVGVVISVVAMVLFVLIYKFLDALIIIYKIAYFVFESVVKIFTRRKTGEIK